MKWGRYLLALLGLTLGALLAYWWMEIRLIPTLRLSHTVGKGNSVELDWIEVG